MCRAQLDVEFLDARHTRRGDRDEVAAPVGRILLTFDALAGDQVILTFARAGLDDPAPWRLGTVNRYRLRRVQDGWLIASLTSTPVWSQNRRAS